MLDFLAGIWHVISQIGCWILFALQTAFNGLIAAIALIVQGLLWALPDFPEMPDLPATMTLVLGWIAWVWPVSTTLTILGTLLGLWLAWQGISLVLRWAKAIQ